MTVKLTLTCDEGLRWYRSSPQAERGFCQHCGASLFWRMDGEGRTSIGSGTLNLPTGMATAKHIFVADKSDYYQIEPGPEQLP
ncbi:GFA family protein [Thioclava sp.]|uniref:GFA family protein n=1 Tax=Thioclava sp. TaxID=1933450 RepID=UPI003AA7D3DC